MKDHSGLFKLEIDTPFLNNEMAKWYIELGDVHIRYSLKTTTIYFNRPEDRIAFKLKFKL